MRALSLFSGIGGIDIAGEWAGIETVAFCEREPFPCRVLRKHYPGIPIYDDVKTLTKEVLEQDGIIGPGRAIDLIHGGYPCQPFSTAGKRLGQADDRHLWPEVKRLLEEIRPRWFLGENVAGHITLGLDDVLSDLESIGYTAQAFVIPAAAVYASHRRDRVFIVGYAERIGCNGKPRRRTREESADGYRGMESGIVGDSSSQGLPERRQSERTESNAETGRRPVGGPERSGEALADTEGKRWREGRTESARQQRELCSSWGHTSCRTDSNRPAQSRLGRELDEFPSWLDGRGINPLDAITDMIAGYPQPALLGMPQHEWEPPRVATGVRNRTARLKALGNAVDPLQIYPILYAIKLKDDVEVGMNARASDHI